MRVASVSSRSNGQLFFNLARAIAAVPDLHALGVELVLAHVPFAEAGGKISLEVIRPGESAVADE